MSKKTDTRVVESRDDAEMMRRPNLWPRWPVLPLKRRSAETGFPETGMLVEASDVPLTTVLVGTIFDADVFALPRKEYESADAIVADGWIVD